MNLFQKSTALLMAAILSVAALTGCSSAGKGDSSDAADPNKTYYLYDENDRPVDVENIATVNGEPIPLEEYRYYFLSEKSYYEQMLAAQMGDEASSGPEVIWANNQETLDTVKEQALQYSIFDRVAKKYAADNNITLTEDDQKKIDEMMQSTKDQYETPEAFQEALVGQNMTEDLYRFLLESQTIQEKIQSTMVAVGSPLAPSEEEIKKNFDENYLHAKHVLIMTQGITDQAELDEKKAIADRVAERAKAGENFDDLVKEYGEDPGMEQQPEGYYFGEGEMVTEFYEGTKALEVNGISDPVQTSYGWHIIQRLPIEDDYYETNKDQIQSKILQNEVMPKLNEQVSALMESAVVEKAPEFDLIGATNLK